MNSTCQPRESLNNCSIAVSSADKAYREMKALKESQSIIVSGEYRKHSYMYIGVSLGVPSFPAMLFV